MPLRTLAPVALLLAALAAGCATPPPVRQVATLDPSLPTGRIEGERFTGGRIPLEISAAGTGWQLATEFPRFLLDQGYEEEGLRQSQVFLSNPVTLSSLQVSLSPAGAYDTFTQAGMEWLAELGAGGMEEELDAEFGKGGYTLTHGKSSAYRLAGVPYAARNFSVYEARGKRVENGWIYGFAEPFQVFVLYQLNDPDQGRDRQALEAILQTFRYTGPPAP